MAGLHLGVDIGFHQSSVAEFVDGVPQELFAFSAMATRKVDRTHWHFDFKAAKNHADAGNRPSVPVKSLLLECGFSKTKSFVRVSAALTEMFAFIKRIVIVKRGKSPSCVAMVLSHGLHGVPEMRQAVMNAWKKNDVLDVFCIADTTAILLTYTVLTLNRQSIGKSATGSYNLLVCSADTEHFRINAFRVNSNNHVVKYPSNHRQNARPTSNQFPENVLWNCFGDFRKDLIEYMYQELQRVGMPALDERSRAELTEECLDQVARFNKSHTEKVVVRAPNTAYAVSCTRAACSVVVEPRVSAIQQHVTAELMKLGIMDEDTQCINGKVEVLLVGENSRWEWLRSALEQLTNSQVSAGAATYEDSAESYGAAIASRLVESCLNASRRNVVCRLEDGTALDMGEVMDSLLVKVTYDSAQPTRDTFVTERPDTVLSGELSMGGHEKRSTCTISDCRLLLTMREADLCKVHCIQLEYPSQKDDQPVVLISMVLGVDVHIKLQEEHYPKDHLWLQMPLKYRCVVGRSSLWFIAKKPADYGPFIEDYKARLRDMQIAFPFAANADTLLKNPYYSSLGAFAALVSDQVDTEDTEEAPELRASIVSVTRCPVQGLVIIVQVCDEVTCHLYNMHMMKHTLPIVRPNKMNRVREEPDTVVVEFTRHDSESVRIIFPDAATGRAFVRKCGFSLSSGF